MRESEGGWIWIMYENRAMEPVESTLRGRVREDDGEGESN
jgi:hypothetical protein